MKLFITITILTLFFSQNENNCIITQNGLNDIVLDSSNLREVTIDFGEMKSNKEWQNSIEMEIFGNYRYSKAFENQGIVFYAEREKGKKIINDIVLTKGCRCKTKEGIGIGSSYQDLKKAFGQPYFNNDEKKPSIHYEPNMFFWKTEGEYVLTITYNNLYITMSNNDTTIAKIKEIRIL